MLEDECNLLVDWLSKRPYRQYTDVDVFPNPECLVMSENFTVTIWASTNAMDKAPRTVNLRSDIALEDLRLLATMGVGHYGQCNGFWAMFVEKSDEDRMLEIMEARDRSDESEVDSTDHEMVSDNMEAGPSSIGANCSWINDWVKTPDERRRRGVESRRRRNRARKQRQRATGIEADRSKSS